MIDIDAKYKEVTEWMFGQIPMFQNIGANAYKPGLERVEALAGAFGVPQDKFRTIHVGGTNGKGSTSSLLASVLMEHYGARGRVGLFTSPHLIDFRERIRINGQVIPREEVVDFIERYRSMHLAVEPSFFELTTVMAFDWFARNDVDVAVIEVGLGGRLDSTNIINPLVSVITNISLDHTALLGHTAEEIAREKAGIIKAGVPAVIGQADRAVRLVFVDKAIGVGSPLVFAQDSISYEKLDIDGDTNIYINTVWGDIVSPLTGMCQAENANTVFHVLPLLPYEFSAQDVRAGFVRVVENSGLMGRWTVVSHNPQVICDTGHNPGGWEFLGPRLQALADAAPLRMVIGFVNDKDVDSILRMMPRNAEYFFTSPSVKRGRPAGQLEAEARDCGLQGRAYPDVESAFRAAKYGFPAEGTIFVGGSTFIVADFLNL